MLPFFILLGVLLAVLAVLWPRKGGSRPVPVKKVPVAKPAPKKASKEAVGLRGENMMRHALDDNLDAADYVVLHDVMIPGLAGMPTQIDHLVVSRFGIFVIEMKNWMGEISARTRKWTKRRGGREQVLSSPVRQNERHGKTLSVRLNIPEPLIHALVAVSHNATFPDGMPKDVYFYSQIPEAIRRFADPVIKPEQVPEIVSAVRAWSASVSERDRERFVDNLRKRYGEEVHSGAG